MYKLIYGEQVKFISGMRDRFNIQKSTRVTHQTKEEKSNDHMN